MQLHIVGFLYILKGMKIPPPPLNNNKNGYFHSNFDHLKNSYMYKQKAQECFLFLYLSAIMVQIQSVLRSFIIIRIILFFADLFFNSKSIFLSLQIIVHGTTESTQALSDYCKNTQGFIQGHIFTPAIGEVVDATRERHIYQVSPDYQN